ncbi:MAG: magnesium-translocating P-type ATPase [Deltaproteobacteria bacterium]|nr:magnesium-translocating P-type ATPase [Deltaproteobacteria bacterium]
MEPSALQTFWDRSAAELLKTLDSSERGLSQAEAKRRLGEYGENRIRTVQKHSALFLLLGQFKSPIILTLLFAAALSFFLHDVADALIILAIVLISGLLGFWQEKGAADAVDHLLALVSVQAAVLRESAEVGIPVEEVVPGDVLLLKAGVSAAADGLLLESRDLFVDEASLTGETYPVEKTAGVLAADTPLSGRTNAVFMGTHVISGMAKVLVCRTGKETEFGGVSERLRLRPAETEFERGVRRFGYLLLEVTLTLVIAIFAINVYFARPVLEAFLFSLALAVGLTPQLLPAIISINLAHGARRMADHKVIVKRLAAIENFGSMDVLCSDKTGTLTEGLARIHSAVDAAGQPNEKILLYAYLNAFFETGYANPIDEAIRAYRPWDTAGYEKLDEIPYDFLRKRLNILFSVKGQAVMITKGPLAGILSICTETEEAGGVIREMKEAEPGIRGRYESFSGEGYRVLGIACREMGDSRSISKKDEAGMTFLGMLVFFDPPKAGLEAAVERLRGLGVSLKVITGDNRLVAASLSRKIGLVNPAVLAGPELHLMSGPALLRAAEKNDIFAEIEPNQKERIVLALKKAGHVVGYLGDGINDASALHSADVGISVDKAADVAKEAADIVLLEKDLDVLAAGVEEGRMTFANTLKYVFMATSANFGNMFSMAGASLFLSFLPLLPKQILLTNLLTDLPEMTIATDRVDAEMILRPRRWDIAFIRRFMLTFGLLSSVFDYLTFGVLIWLLKATPEEFRTGWFLESVISASLIVLLVRSRRPFFKSLPSAALLTTTLAVVVMTLLLPLTPLAGLFGFQPLPVSFLLLMGLIVLLYIGSAEWVKRAFYAKPEAGGAPFGPKE